MFANFGPSYIPDSGYKVDQSVAFTELPEVLRPVRSRVEALVSLANPSCAGALEAAGVSEATAERVCLSLRSYAMSSASRAGRQGPFSQAFVQRYQALDNPQDDMEDENVSQALGMHFDSRGENGEVVAGVSLGAAPGAIFFSRRGPGKGRPFPLSVARELEGCGEGMLVMLPQRSLYLFYGFARFHLRHGVPWCGTPGTAYDRFTVTFRSVPLPVAMEDRAGGRQPDRCDPKQMHLEDVLDGFRFTSIRAKEGPQKLRRKLPSDEFCLEEEHTGRDSALMQAFPVTLATVHTVIDLS